MAFVALVSVAEESPVADAVGAIVPSSGVAGPALPSNVEEPSAADASLGRGREYAVGPAGLAFVIDDELTSGIACALEAGGVPG